MIEVQIILSPRGNTNKRKLIGQMFIVNDLTGTEEDGNYEYIFSDERKTLGAGTIVGHRRFRGPWVLIEKILTLGRNYEKTNGTP